jgi:hypothetical protein
MPMLSYIDVILLWAAFAFRSLPVDVFVNHFDRTCFAMNAVLTIDLQTFLAFLVFYKFVNFGWTKPMIVLMKTSIQVQRISTGSL